MIIGLAYGYLQETMFFKSANIKSEKSEFYQSEDGKKALKQGIDPKLMHRPRSSGVIKPYERCLVVLT